MRCGAVGSGKYFREPIKKGYQKGVQCEDEDVHSVPSSQNWCWLIVLNGLIFFCHFFIFFR